MNAAHHAVRLPTKPGRLVDNVMGFARLLRRAGFALGQDRLQLALQALAAAGLHSRADFQATLAACFLSRPDQQALFDEAFNLYWRVPEGLAALGLAPPAEAGHTADATAPPMSQRLAAAMYGQQPALPGTPSLREPDTQAQAASPTEQLRHTDFQSMSADEWAQARQLIQALTLLLLAPLRTRRAQPARQAGTPDWRASLRALARQGDAAPMRWRRPVHRPAPLVLLADVSGSMSRYTRMLLHFAHALGNSGARVHSFVFGTRLTPISRSLAQRDPDVAVAQIAQQVQDWSGGTRITASLHDFNLHWSRRVLGGQATVLLITDGLEHGDTTRLAFEMERLHKSCRQLLWLNPLLRYSRFEPKAAGIRAMLPHVDRFLPVHDLASLEGLAQVLLKRT
ncbi:MAG: VWA domain-containing protein [Burkholderiales bacterium]